KKALRVGLGVHYDLSQGDLATFKHYHADAHQRLIAEHEAALAPRMKADSQAQRLQADLDAGNITELLKQYPWVKSLVLATYASHAPMATPQARPSLEMPSLEKDKALDFEVSSAKGSADSNAS